MANDLFKRAKAYKKKHPRATWQGAIKACAGKKTAAVGKARKAPKTVVKARTAIIGKAKKAGPVKKAVRSITKALGIGSIAMGNIRHDQACIAKHTRMIEAEKKRLAGATPKEKIAIRKQIAKHQDMIRSHKQSITNHKKHL